MKKEEKIKNRLISDLRNMKHEIESGTIITEELLYGFFAEILLDAKVDSKIIVNVLESEEFGELGEDEARYIKINEGW